ncbi:hypothetical protein H2200_001228 [Cladophialophora chaetospira]|uniref:A-kinase anchor protein 7-like phosphoesterase domain-containing protein n=1 Tax=Cladophialophora chaetospira TaxID=386627 RepID=A0AA38XKH8_9EURO|nr:hypothetical protein H2200_001228 [Cladophialophora chaetospira]
MPKRQGQKPNKKPATHFLCFPLTTHESVRQLSDSLAYFESITAHSPGKDPGATPEREGSQGPARESALDQSNPVSSVSQSLSPETARKLQVIPEKAHRPPGTYHFTLGTMDLSSQEEMDKAVALLREIDYLALLMEAEQRAPAGTREDGQGGSLQRAAGADQRVEGVEERAGSKVERGLAKVGGFSDKGASESTAITPNTTTNAPPSPAVNTLRSLTRPISPPPPSSHPRHPQPITQPITQTASHPAPLSITLHSLGVFPSASQARVFFAHPIDPTRRLKIFSILIRERFNAADLILDQRPLVLHATVANLIYAKHDSKRAGRARRGGGHAVDAREILRFFNGELGGDGGVNKAPPMPDEKIALESAGKIELEGSGQKFVAPGEEARSTSAASDAQVQLRAFRRPHPIPYIWARDIPITSIRICKMGAEPSDKPGWELEYRAVAEEVFLPATSQEILGHE